MSRPALGVALILILAALVLLASSVAGNLGALPAIGVPIASAAGGYSFGGTSQSALPPPPNPSPFARAEVFSSLIVLGVLVGFMAWRLRKVVPRERGGPFGFLFVAMAIGIFVAIMIGGRAVIDLLIPTEGLKSGTADYLEASAVVYATAALAVSVIAASLVYSLRGRRMRSREPEGPGSTVVDDVTKVLHRTIYSLRGGSDHRQAVLACYVALCRVLQEGGAEDRPELTAREFEVLAAAKLNIRTSYLDRMTQLFEKARYSHDVVDEEDARSAEASLLELERELHVRPPSPLGGGMLT